MKMRNVIISEVKVPTAVRQSGILYQKKATKIKTAVRLFCGECMGMSRTEKDPTYPIEDITGCTDKMCPLFEWRLGKNPYPSKSRVESGRKLAAKQR